MAYEQMLAASAAIRAFREERGRLIEAEHDPAIRVLAEEASRHMHDLLKEVLSVYRCTLERIDLEKRQCGMHHPKLEELMREWQSSESIARELFDIQIDALKRGFKNIFRRNNRRNVRNSRNKKHRQ